MKHSLLTLTVVATVGMGSILTGAGASPALASTKLQELENQKKALQQERSGINSGINEAEGQINQLQGQQDNVQNEIQQIELVINDTNSKIAEKEGQIEATKVEIEKLQGEIQVLMERIEKRNQMLKDRARSFQETGGSVSYVDVLMGAQSFSDFIDRVGAVTTIVEADQGILRQHREDKELLEKKQTEVQQQLADLEKMHADLENMRQQLDSQKAEQNRLMASLEQQEQHVEDHKMSLEEEAAILAAQETAMAQAIQMEQQRQAELARQAAELEKKRKEQEAAAKATGNKGGNSNGASVSTPPVANGAFTRPASGRLTSGYGMRPGGFHYGADIANRADGVPILAAADGVVIKSEFSKSYGNVVYIAHSINGQTFTSVYAHMSSRAVQSGFVAKGQQIGIMGNTGDSDGQHLHFELHKGGWNSAKSNAVNPAAYVPL
ncbi:peptidase M23 [Bacillus canaveralius]|uniref:Peptidase M23 n=1 Tax=Bacillus canaveralius TaxID=1403243 RepID=A0A2N5GMT3_9BACI|nr:peptidoglycan DD-metalloendopeptidase family protein [Bacillus canaveralius]PLR83181.1 peptidase M23 [Bacillus canaveralius]PLR94099.1 peptidase M23 [Bacillus canaveralius]RSK54101.1 peptidase M23 [Bacillus canaveralius]